MNIKFMLAGLLGIVTGYGLSTLPITDELTENDKAKTVLSINATLNNLTMTLA